MKEIATITVIQGKKTDYERVLHTITGYLDNARHCMQYVLALDTGYDETYSTWHSNVLSCEWDSRKHRALAWDYFSRLFAMAGVEIHVTLAEQSVSTAAFGCHNLGSGTNAE